MMKNFPGKQVGAEKTISRLTHRNNQYKLTVLHLHDRLASIQHAKKNRDAHIGRLKNILEFHGICDICGKKSCSHQGT